MAGRPQSRIELSLRNSEDHRKCCALGNVSKTSQLLQCILRLGRQAGELADQKINDVVGVALGVNAVDIPGPARAIMIECEESFLDERRQELNGEKRIAAGLHVAQLR